MSDIRRCIHGKIVNVGAPDALRCGYGCTEEASEAEIAVENLARAAAKADAKTGGLENFIAGVELIQAALKLREQLTLEERRALVDELRRAEETP